MESTPTYSMCFDLRGRRDSPQKNQRISRLRATPQERLSVLIRDETEYRKEMKTFCTRFMGSSGPLLFSCGAGDHVCIDAYGMIQPCLLLRMPKVCYNVRKGSLREALTVFFPRIKKISTENPNYLNRCARCFIMGLCEQCPAKSWSEHGTLDTPVEYLCEIAHAQAEYLGLIEPGELAWEVRNGDERVRKFRESGTGHPE
jgi:radical SAM protein with 4Fe4S-binding SPASM domain